MSMLKSIEDKLEGLVEGLFGRTFKASVQPVELAHKLAKEMGDHKTLGVSHVYVPNEYDIYLGKDDFEKLSGLGDPLKAELSNYLTAYARREGWMIVSEPRIELRRDDELRVGEFGIATRTVKPPAREAGPGDDAPAVAPALAPVAPVEGPALAQTVLYDRPPAAPHPPAPAAPRYALRGQGVEAVLGENGTLVIGRSRRCDIVLTDPNVSRQHAEVRLRGTGVVLRDLDSTNGTRVNGRAVRETAVRPGDRIELGTTLLRLERLG